MNIQCKAYTMEAIVRALSALMLVTVLLYAGVQAQQPARQESKIKVGVLTMESIGKNADLSGKATDDLLLMISDVGFYEIYAQQNLENAMKKIHKKMPRRCRDPRAVIEIGGALGMDRMIYGSIDNDDKSIGVHLVLVDVVVRQTIEDISVKGDPGTSEIDVLKAAFSKLHGNTSDKQVTISPYFGPKVNNEKEWLYTSAGMIGFGLLYSLVNYSVESPARDLVYEYHDDPLSGIASSADQIPMFARPAALANAYTAMSDDAYGPLYNPAGVAWVKNAEAAVAYQYRYGVVNNFAATYVNKATREIGFGQALLYSGDPAGALTEIYFVSSIAYKFNSILTFLRPISLGVNVKIVSDRIEAKSLDSPNGTSFGAGLDCGLLWELSDKIRYGLLFRDIPVVNYWKNFSTGKRYFEANAATVHMGGTFQVGYSTLLIAEGQLPLNLDQGWKMAGGVEQEMFKFFLLRAGLQKEIQNSIETPWKATGGFGVKMDRVCVDGSYEYNTLGVFGVPNVSLRIGF